MTAREEFEKWVAPNHTKKEYKLLERCFRDGYVAGHKSRQPEIDKLKEAINHVLAGYGKSLGSDFCSYLASVSKEGNK